MVGLVWLAGDIYPLTFQERVRTLPLCSMFPSPLPLPPPLSPPLNHWHLPVLPRVALNHCAQTIMHPASEPFYRPKAVTRPRERLVACSSVLQTATTASTLHTARASESSPAPQYPAGTLGCTHARSLTDALPLFSRNVAPCLFQRTRACTPKDGWGGRRRSSSHRRHSNLHVFRHATLAGAPDSVRLHVHHRLGLLRLHHGAGIALCAIPRTRLPQSAVVRAACVAHPAAALQSLALSC
jgi:hypothetical protein